MERTLRCLRSESSLFDARQKVWVLMVELRPHGRCLLQREGTPLASDRQLRRIYSIEWHPRRVGGLEHISLGRHIDLLEHASEKALLQDVLSHPPAMPR